MHSSVLQNEKYIGFASDNCVDVIAEGSLPSEWDNPKDAHSATYEAKDADGKPVKYLKEFPGMTAEDLAACDSSPASQYNHTGAIPYTAIVDPHTLKEIRGLSGGQSASSALMRPPSVPAPAI